MVGHVLVAIQQFAAIYKSGEDATDKHQDDAVEGLALLAKLANASNNDLVF